MFTCQDKFVWGNLEHFYQTEAWGDWMEMDVRLLFCLDRLRARLGRRINIHCGYEQSGHSPRSFHKYGMAVDFDVEGTKLSELFDLYRFFQSNWYFGGIGVYPFWNNPGIHLDVGPVGRTWLRDKDNNYIYDYNEMYNVLTSL